MLLLATVGSDHRRWIIDYLAFETRQPGRVLFRLFHSYGKDERWMSGIGGRGIQTACLPGYEDRWAVFLHGVLCF